MKSGIYTVVILSAIFLSACGGGGGGDSSTTPVINAAPVANAGVDQSVITNSLVTLDGSKSSDVNNDQLTYAWTFSTKPVGSSITLTNPTSSKPTFTADSAGSYVVNLVVNDGKVNSNTDSIEIVVSVDKLIILN